VIRECRPRPQGYSAARAAAPGLSSCGCADAASERFPRGGATGSRSRAWRPRWQELPAKAVGTGTYQLKLNGHDRFAARDYRYFTRTQVWQHHTGCGGLNANDGSATASGQMNDSIAVYSFALKPEEHQPSGTCNFSRIDNAQLIAESTGQADTIFAVNYNVLRIMSGMGGLAYSN